MSYSSNTPSGSRNFGPSTLAIHAGEARQKIGDAITDPIVCASTYTFTSTQAVIDFIEQKQEREEYGRYGNPGEKVVEKKLAALEGGEEAILYASGMAAIVGLLMTKLSAGDEVVPVAARVVALGRAQRGAAHVDLEAGDRGAEEESLRELEVLRSGRRVRRASEERGEGDQGEGSGAAHAVTVAPRAVVGCKLVVLSEACRRGSTVARFSPVSLESRRCRSSAAARSRHPVSTRRRSSSGAASAAPSPRSASPRPASRP